MVRSILSVLLMSIFLILTNGCTTLPPPPTSQEVASANYGDYPDNYEEIVKNFISNQLIDPYSAVYSGWKGPTKGWMVYIGGVIYGYSVCVDVNAKNRMGGYTGRSQWYILVRNGIIQHHLGGYPPGTMGEQEAVNACSGVH